MVLPHGAEAEAEGRQGLAWVVDGYMNLQTKLPDFYNLQPLSLDWNGAGASPSITPPGGCSLPWGSWVPLGLLT